MIDSLVQFAAERFAGIPKFIEFLALFWVPAAVVVLLLAYAQLTYRHRVMARRLAAVEETTKLLRPISVLFRRQLAEKLTHDYAPEMDELLRKLCDEGTPLTSAEKARLLVLLAERQAEAETIDERAAAKMMPDVIDQVERDTADQVERDTAQ